MRKIPVTMATQHPDNAGKSPFFDKRFVSTTDEIEECARCFSELGVQEYMWDWEGKFVDEAVIDRLFQNYFELFKKNQLGRDKFLTFRVPNIWEEAAGKHRLQRAFMNVISSEGAAKNFKFHTPPVFEAILPMTTSSDQLIYLQEMFQKIARASNEIFETESTLKRVELIPLVEDITSMADTSVVEKYVDYLEEKFEKPEYLRIFVARSDPAMNAGLIPTMMAVKSLLSNYHEYGYRKEIEIYPWIGGGSLPFRGAVNPENIDAVLDEYAGTASITIQSAFRSDYPLEEVKNAISRLNSEIPGNRKKYIKVTAEESQRIKEFNQQAADIFQKTIEPLAGVINFIAGRMPGRRERVQHTGLFGYARGVGSVTLPRAIKFTGSFYSLGVPPEFISTGRVLKLAKEQGMIDLVEKLYVNMKADLIHAGKYLNKENLRLLAAENSAFQPIMEDIEEIEKYLGIELGPQRSRHYLHRNFTSNIYHLWKSEKDFSHDLQHAAEFRKSLG